MRRAQDAGFDFATHLTIRHPNEYFRRSYMLKRLNKNNDTVDAIE